ncbi:SRPBCC family protein [Streptomyces sp. BBFR2]|uniref:type II toxin-antitoxin system Rv0910 family toxin n=1 Tax=Streptomyces sp. BBFR2 TaxID=3372854 RepID=UPI0037DA56CA
MAAVTAQMRIGAPSGQIWERLTDFEGYGRWNATHTGFPQGGPDPLRAGTEYLENMKLMGFPAEVRWTVRELRPERLLDIRSKGPMGVTLTMRYALEPDGAATTVRIDGEFTGAAVSLMAGKLKDSAGAALEASLRDLAALVI